MAEKGGEGLEDTEGVNIQSRHPEQRLAIQPLGDLVSLGYSEQLLRRRRQQWSLI